MNTKIKIALALGALSIAFAATATAPTDQEYAVFFYETPAGFASRDNHDAESYWQEWTGYIGGIAASGAMTGGSALREPASGMRVDNDGTHRLAGEAPQLSGFVILKGENLEQVLEVARKSPALPAGGFVEVRPLLPMEQHN